MKILYIILICNFIFASNSFISNDLSAYYFSKLEKQQFNNNIVAFLKNLKLLDEKSSFTVHLKEDPIFLNKHYILNQTFHGIEVFSRNILVHFNINNEPSSYSNNFFRGIFENMLPSLKMQDAKNIVSLDFNENNAIYKNIKLMYYVDDIAELVFQIDAVTYTRAFRYLINAHSGEILKRWTLIYDDGPVIGSGENLLGEWVYEINIYEGMTFSPTGDLVTPYLLCENYCFDYGDCGGTNNSDCEINPIQGECPENYIEDCNGVCFHVWYLQFPGIGNGFCNDPWIDVSDDQISGGLYNMVDESNVDTGVIFTINSYGGFYEDLSYVNADNSIFDSSIASLSHAAGVSAHDYQRKTLDYFWNHHAYAGPDGNGKRSISVINYGTGGGISQNNAFYNAGIDVCSYGIAGGSYRPFCAAQDIVAHEFTHGFTAHTSGLIYENQSGAMNESMSDVFGYFVEAEYQDGGDWTEGEDIRINGGASRSFSNPPTYGDPDNINHSYYVPYSENPTFNNDMGGVHSNSGIVNKILYLVVQGDEHYGIQIDPLNPNIDIARNIASDIWFNWNKYYLDAEDDFNIGRMKMLQVVSDLYPSNTNLFQSIANAWASVGVGDAFLSGDVNNDSIINIQDIIIIINFILDTMIPTENQLFSGDINFDGIIDILDIVLIVNIIFD
tara:strand:+ start:97 stop:2106 length:2010 start_codon:yes stop_codon:yes gene_type:complete